MLLVVRALRSVCPAIGLALLLAGCNDDPVGDRRPAPPATAVTAPTRFPTSQQKRRIAYFTDAEVRERVERGKWTMDSDEWAHGPRASVHKEAENHWRAVFSTDN